jgi:hypothetical protein
MPVAGTTFSYNKYVNRNGSTVLYPDTVFNQSFELHHFVL